MRPEINTPGWYKALLLDADYYDVDERIAVSYLDSLLEHIRFVQEAGLKLGLKESQLIDHDSSKFTIHEFPGYAMHFKGGGDPNGFARAWLNHLHHNPHHWNHWVHPGDDYHVKGSDMEANVLPMPQRYALEMVADWQGANRAYTGSWDMTDWLSKNWHRIKLHSQTREYVRQVLDSLGYADIVNMSEGVR